MLLCSQLYELRGREFLRQFPQGAGFLHPDRTAQRRQNAREQAEPRHGALGCTCSRARAPLARRPRTGPGATGRGMSVRTSPSMDRQDGRGGEATGWEKSFL